MGVKKDALSRNVAESSTSGNAKLCGAGRSGLKYCPGFASFRGDCMYALNDVAPASLRIARAWLLLGIAALAGSGLLAVLLALARTPGVQNWLPQGDFFRAALIVHVDLSVLVWFMAFAAVLWSLAGDGRHAAAGMLGVWLAAGGTALMVVAPFLADARPLLNNYIPILRQPVFFAGLLLALAGFAVAMLRALTTIRVSAASPTRFAVLLAALIGLAALATGLLSWLQAPAEAAEQAYFETLFWGGGHVLQFQHALLAAVAWFWLAEDIGQAPRLSARLACGLFGLAALPILALPVMLALAPVGSAAYFAGFAKLMEVGHPLMLPLLLLAGVALWRGRARAAPAKSALAASLLLHVVAVNWRLGAARVRLNG